MQEDRGGVTTIEEVGQGDGRDELPSTCEQLLEEMIEKEASDLHITTGAPPQLRVDGDIVDSSVDRGPDAEGHAAAGLLGAHRDPEEAVRDRGRARLLVRHPEPGALPLQRASTSAAACRRSPPDSRSRSRPSRSSACRRSSPSWPSGRAAWCSSPGPTGSGKSTTLAAMIDKINTERHDHILTIEDPIEFIHRHKSCIVNQREVGTDTKSFARRAQVRAARGSGHRPDRRDARPRDDRGGADDRRDRPPGVRHAAHQLARRRRSTASSTSSRRTSRRRSARSSPSCSRASSPRRCCPRRSGRGRVMACEIMVATPAIRDLIRDDKVHQIYSRHAGRQEVRHADDERRAVPALHQPRSGSGGVRAGVARSQGVPPDDRQSRRWRTRRWATPNGSSAQQNRWPAVTEARTACAPIRRGPMPLFEYTARNAANGQIQKGQLDVASQGRRQRVPAEEPADPGERPRGAQADQAAAWAGSGSRRATSSSSPASSRR